MVDDLFIFFFFFFFFFSSSILLVFDEEGDPVSLANPLTAAAVTLT